MSKIHDTNNKNDDNKVISTFNKSVDNGKKALTFSMKIVNFICAIPFIAHIIRAAKRFTDRMGNQFGAAITYFSFLSLIPVLMFTFAAAGFVLASNPDLLEKLIRGISGSISDPTLASTLERTIDTAIRQRTTVGLTGLALAVYSGVNWVNNLRQAILAQSRPVWERNEDEQEKIYFRYLRDFLALIGLLIALIITITLTSVAGSAQATIVRAIGLEGIEWLRPVWTLIGLTIAITANFLLFLWIFWILPRMQHRRSSLLKGTLLAAIGFEIIKSVMTWMLPNIASSPSGAAFGSVIGLMAFFYFFARLTLFCAAWIATDEPKGSQSQQVPA
ncbi:inner membrane protein YhjD [Moellerella wisconsensis]|uniref:Inner membrane protein YhjD n=3 Tax=Moellerella wisconsensis TaxID=158849 RepID=A0A9Q8V3L2_9GAMM|nr:inner membrane protein YhjD [Moellerella wisconsensis]KLN97568.1 membrane protein [Moellerella wisconsensis]UNH30963.1 inner membrane protein YhjD [Moellerella wisconsensis]UNH39108.1 inner membrane protein YhjD [Moellerella wisconsensis]UNH42628.1 inner membrane protein YhjD [Moellerella wisconsensis]WJW82093.1 inner membrane protein YhjD [Moellerella wisconsensis]